MLGGKMKGGGEMSSISPLVSFMLGAAMATVCVLFFMSASPARRLVDISAFSSRNATQDDLLSPVQLEAGAADGQNDTAGITATPAPAPAPAEAASAWGDLEEVLRRAATKDRTVIMTQINAAWTRPGSLLDLFFESFRRGEGGVARLLEHLVIVTMDPAAYEGCQEVHRHCYFLRTSNGVDYRSEKMFMSKDYLEMMWGRNRFQQTVLELGYNFLFTAESEDAEFRGLAAVVERAASPDDRTVIITCVNHAWAAPGSLLDLFLESFRIGDGIAHLLDHVLIVAMDPTAMARCRAVHRHCYLYTMPGIDFTSAKFFLSKEYLELVWSKLKLQRRVLQLGYNFLFTDVDIMWFRNPFKHVTAYADMSISSDVFFGDPDNINNFPNTGFFHVRPNNRTIAMTRVWHEARSRFPGMNEQPVFNAIKKSLVKELRLRVQYIDPAFMGGFCNYGKDLNKICTMHANCCVGLGAKLRDLRTVLDDWRNYTRMPHWARHAAKWTVPGACIH